MKKHIYLLILFSSLCYALAGQVREKRVYVLDWTKTMIGYGGAPKVWGQLRDMLLTNINEIDEQNTEVILLCFSDRIDHTLEGKEAILDFLKDKKNEPTGMKTNLTLAWEEGLKKVDPNKYNFITFLTDGGEQNVRGAQPFDECIRSEKVGSWKDIVSKYSAYLCYVRLTETAFNEKIDSALNSNKNISILDGIKFPVIIRSLLDKNSFRLNIKEQKKIELNLPVDIVNQQELDEKSLSFHLELIGNYSEIAQTGKTTQLNIIDMRIPVALSVNKRDEELDQYPEEFELLLKISSNDKLIAIPNSEIKLQIMNKREKAVAITTNICENRASYHPSFLFSESQTTPIHYQLKTEWGKFTRPDSKALVTLKLYKEKNEKHNYTDFKMYVDGKENATHTLELGIEDTSKDIELYLDPERGGKYLLEMHYEGVNIDNIYPANTEQFKVTNTIRMNPLKKACIIISIILLGLLIIWKVFLSKTIYPRFSRIRSFQMRTPVFKSIKLKGARKVVFSNQKKSQNFLARFFTGKIIYVNQPVWTDGTIEAVPHNRVTPMRLRFKTGYRNLPKSLKRGESYTFFNQQGEKIEIIIM